MVIRAPPEGLHARREFGDRELNWFTHAVAPIVGILVMLLPLLSLFLPFFVSECTDALFRRSFYVYFTDIALFM